MKKFFESNLFYGILSVLMAVFLLFYVDSSEDPVVTKPFANVPVTVSGLGEGLLLDAEPGPVEIQVSGFRSVVNMVNARDVKASVDLSNVAPGTARYQVKYSLPSGLTLVSIWPGEVELAVDRLDTRLLPVSCQLLNSVQEGYGNIEPVLSPAEISVTGPARVLDSIAGAQVSVDLSGLSSDYRQEQAIVLLDQEGQLIEREGLSLSDDEVLVHVVITESLSSKSVSVRAAISGALSDRYIFSGVEVEPSTVVITGSYAAISPLEFLTTETVDLTGMTETYQGQIRLLAPDNIEIHGGDLVEITVWIEENLTERTLEGIPVEVRGAPEGYAYGTIPLTVDVTLAAYAEVFAGVSLEDGGYRIDVKAFVDLAGEPADTRDYTVLLEYPDEYRVVGVSEPTVRLYAD